MAYSMDDRWSSLDVHTTFSAPCVALDRSQPSFDATHRHAGVLKGFVLYYRPIHVI